jgi:hypothetical protein
MTRDVAVRAGGGILLVAAIATSMGTGWLVAHRPVFALVVGIAVLIIAVAITTPVAIPLMAMPLLVVSQRLGAGPFDMTLSDWMLGLAFWPAALLSPRPLSRELRNLLWANAAYQALTLFTVVANPSMAGVVEWFHAWLLVSGALILGWALGRAGQARVGMSLFLGACVFLSALVLIAGGTQWAQGDFGPVYLSWPWPVHKNLLGSLIAVGAVVTYVRPQWLGWSPGWAWGAFWAMTLAIVMTRSEQGLVGLAVGVAIVALRSRAGNGVGRSRLILLLAVPALAVIYTVVREEYFSDNPHNSIRQRIDWLGESLGIWGESPVVGHGLRYWTQPDAPGTFQPPNAILEVLASAGVIGLVGFVLLMAVTLVTAWRLDPGIGTVAVGVTVTRLVQSQFDLFWVSISVSVPFVLVGICLGVAAHQEAQGRAGPPRHRVPVGSRR